MLHSPTGHDDSRDESRLAAVDRALLADERDRIADQRERIADERDWIADERDRIADEREAGLDALLIAHDVEAGHSTQHAREAIRRSDARLARGRAEAERDRAASHRREAARQRDVLEPRSPEDDAERFRHQVLLQARAAVQRARMLRGARTVAIPPPPPEARPPAE